MTTLTTKEIADDLPYRIVEEIGLGYTFRSCTCGQLPCARLRPLRDALEAVRRDERERCAKIVDIAKQFVVAYIGKEHMLGNGQALRAFLKFRELLEPDDK